MISAVSYHGERNLVKQQNRLLTITAVHELDAEPTWLLVLNVVLLDVGRPPVGHMSAGELNTPHQEAFFPVRLIFCGNCVLWLHRARWTRYTRARLSLFAGAEFIPHKAYTQEHELASGEKVPVRRVVQPQTAPTEQIFAQDHVQMKMDKLELSGSELLTCSLRSSFYFSLNLIYALVVRVSIPSGN